MPNTKTNINRHNVAYHRAHHLTCLMLSWSPGSGGDGMALEQASCPNACNYLCKPIIQLSVNQLSVNQCIPIISVKQR